MIRWGAALVAVILALVSSHQHALASRHFASRSEFLRASEEKVREALEVTDLDASEDLDRSIQAVLPAIYRFYGDSPKVRWSNITDETGSSAHPALGVTLNRAQLLGLRAGLDSRSSDDVLTFVLAHELAHMAQYRVYTIDTVSDADRTRPIECQADLWAGMVVVNRLADMRIPPPDGMQRMNSAAAIAFEVGHPSWDDPKVHPRPDQRMLCVATGFRVGLHLRLVRAYEQTHSDDMLAQIKEWQAKDGDLFGPGDDVWAWTRDKAKTITNFEGRRNKSVEAMPNYLDVFRRSASAVERGRDALRKSQSLLVLSNPASCTLEDQEAWLEWECTTSGYASEAIARASYQNYSDGLRFVLNQMGWVEDAPDEREQDPWVGFHRGSAKAHATYNAKRRQVVIGFGAHEE